MVKKCLGIGVAVGFIFCIGISNVEGVTRTWDGGIDANTNWSTPDNWSGDTLPTSIDDVIFDGTSTESCTVNSTVTVASISVNSGYTGTITQSNTINVTVTGSFTQAAGTYTIGVSGAPETLTVNGTYTMSGGSSDSYYTGSIVLNGNATVSGIVSFDSISCSAGSNTTTVTGSGLTINITALNSFTIGTGTVTGTGRISIADGCVLNNSGTINCITRFNAYTATFTVYSGNYAALEVRCSQSSAKAILGGNITCTSLTIWHASQAPSTYTLDTAGYSITASSILLGSEVGSVDLYWWGILKCSGSIINVSGDVIVSPWDGTANKNKKIEADSSTWNIGGTLINFSPVNPDPIVNVGTSTFVFTNNTTLPVNQSTWYNLTAGGAGKTLTLASNVTVSNDLTISSGATLNPSIYTSTVNGNLINNSTQTFTATNLTLNGGLTNSGTLTIGATNLTLNGGLTNSGTLTTNSLTIPSGKQALLNAGSVWNVGSGNTLTIIGTLKSSGTSGNLATIQSSSGYIGLTATSGGSVDLAYCKLYYLNKDGLKIDSTPSAITKMDNVEFKYGESGGTHLQVLNGQSITITNMIFDDILNGTNITVKNKTKIKVNKYRRGKNKDSIESGSSVIWGIEQSIDPKIGGRIVSNDDPLTYIDVPADSQKREMTFTLTQLQDYELSEPSQPTKVIRAYTLDAVDTSGKEIKILDGPITLVIHASTDGTNVLDSSSISTGIKVSEVGNRLSIGYWNERYWVKLGGRTEISNNDMDITVSARVSHLSKYAIVTKEATQAIAVNVSPNPFTPASSDSRFNRVTFSFNNENNEEVELKIWDLTAGLVRTLREYGTSSISWDGRNEYGEIVEGGVYIWQLKVGNSVAGKGTVVVAK